MAITAAGEIESEDPAAVLATQFDPAQNRARKFEALPNSPGSASFSFERLFWLRGTAQWLQ